MKTTLRGVASLYPLLLLAILWEGAARAGLTRPVFLPALSAVLAEAWALLRTGELPVNLLVSLYRAAAGLAIATVLGVAVGLAMARVRFVAWLCGPAVALGFPAPKIAFIPVVILWFGIDHWAKIVLVAFTTVFPMILATQAGAATVPVNQIWAARAMGDGGIGLWRRVILPAALPSILSGLRVSVPIALLTAFTAEMIAGGGGLGGELVLAQRYFETPTVFACLLAMLAAGYVIDALTLRLRAHLLRWQ